MDQGRHLLHGGCLVLGRFGQVTGALGNDPGALGELAGRLHDLTDDVLQVADRGQCHAQPAHVVVATVTDLNGQVSLGRGPGHFHKLVDLGFEVLLGLIDFGLLIDLLHGVGNESSHVA